MTATDSPHVSLEQLRRDHRVALQNFDSLLITLQKSPKMGPSHTLTIEWNIYRTEFRELQLRARTNASHLAACLDVHHRQLGNSTLSVSAKSNLLRAFPESVRNGAQDARHLKDSYDCLMTKVRRFPALVANVISSWTPTWFSISGFCANITSILTSLWERIVNELIPPIRAAIIALWGCPMGSRPQGSRDIPKEPTPREASRCCNVIIDKLITLEGHWEQLLISINWLTLYLEWTNATVDSPGAYRQMVHGIEGAYAPVIEALDALAHA